MNVSIGLIGPRNGGRFSPNLYKWIKSHSNHEMLDVYKSDDSTLYIGYEPEGGFFTGSKLIEVLCQGKSASSWAFAMSSIGPLNIGEGFWDEYERIGRCAIDTNHDMNFVSSDGRWSIVGKTRYCMWCRECTQTLREWQEMVDRSEWINSSI
jgi:hypothetical protein